MKRLSVVLNLIIISSIIVKGQESIMIVPPKIELNYNHCDSASTYISDLLDKVKSWEYQTDFKFYKDNVISVDLNNDGICEYILKYYDGGANIIEEFYEVKNNELKIIGTFREHSYSWLERFNNYPQLLVIYYDGEKTNPIWKFSILRYNGEKYVVYYSPDLTYGRLQNLGLKYYKQKKFKLAEICFRNVLTVYSNSNSIDINNLALSLIRQNKNDEAEDLLLKELTGRKTADTFYNLSLVYKNKGDVENELNYLTKSNNLVESDFKTKRIKYLKLK
jgi:tetratricopeptide (TPR) repeat protein